MSAAAQPTTTSETREDRLIAWFAALAIVIHVLESSVPSPLPGIRPGLANVVTLVVLLRYSLRVAVWVAMLRVLVGSLMIGTFLAPTFMLSFAGALASVAALALGSALPGRGAGPVGLGTLAAMAHVSGQVGLAWLLFVPHAGLFRLLPVLLGMALVLGAISGIIARQILIRLETVPVQNARDHGDADA